MREKPKKLSGYERPIFNLPKLKTKYKKIVCRYLLIGFIITIVTLRYIKELGLSLELSAVLTTSVVIVNEFFELFWETYKSSQHPD